MDKQTSEFKKVFTDKVYPEPNTGCWLWIGSGDRDGYGRVQIKKHSTQAHRFSYQHFKGEIPAGLLVCHQCDTPACVNPDHLFLGTHRDNTQDSVKKRRDFRGNRNKKLTQNQVLEIRERYATGNYTYAQLAIKYHVKPGAITDICLHRNWKCD